MTCTGTAMSDPYRDDYSEFHPTAGWLPACQDTLSHRLTGRSDWETISAIYPWLDESPANDRSQRLAPGRHPGPDSHEPDTPCEVLDVPVFYLSQDGHRVQPGGGARAFLFQGDWLTDLGRPTLDHVTARGARLGDRVCVFETRRRASGLRDHHGWRRTVGIDDHARLAAGGHRLAGYFA